MKINIQKLFAAFKIQRSIIRLFFACLFAVVPQWLFAQLPSDIPSLKLWLRPDTYITLNPDTTINTWKNIIDTNLVFTSPPSVPAILPPHVQNNPAELNNHDVAHFDITRPDGLKSQLPLSLNNNRITVLIFIRYRNSAIGIGHLICYGLGQAGIDSWNLRECSSSGRMSFIWRDTGEGAGAIGSNCFGNTSNLTLTPNFTFVSGFEDPTIPSGGNWFIAENFVHKDSIQLNYIPGDTNTVTLGYREDLAIAGLPYYADFDVAEIMIFDSTLTSSQLADLRSYLQIRYSQLVNLGPDYTTSDLCADTLDAGSYFSSFLWSTGDTTQTIVVNSAGTYYVETTDMYGFLSYDTIVISYPTPALPSTNIICAGDSLPWNTNLGSAYSYLWSTSETTSSIYIDTAGTYTVTVTDSLGCSTSASIIAVMDSFPLTASIGPDSVSLCAGNSIALVSGAAQAQTYSWTPQTPGDDSLSTHVVDTTSGWYYLDVTDTNGCRARD
ncbi:MAG TPA: hypothetical protein VI757_00800, partial [Bacteroidia bacterium]|nr:hypothetical protein [Bacteroidia bacterium]